MRIHHYKTYTYTINLSRRIPIGEEGLSERRGHILELWDKAGHVGRGDVAPLPGFSEEDANKAMEELSFMSYALSDHVPDPALAALDGGFKELLAPHNLCPSVQFGVEAALLGLMASAQGISLARLIAPESGDTIPICGLVAGPRETAAERAAMLREKGFTAVKLKVGGEPERAAELTKAVREALGDDVALRLDANCEWEYDAALVFCKAVADLNVDYLEEPLANPFGVLQLSQASGVPMALDETLLNLYPGVLSNWEGIRAIVLKPTLLGGVERTIRFAREARELGVKPVLSASYECGVGLSILANLAAAADPEPAPAGLDTYDWLAEDILAERLPSPAPQWDLNEINRLAAEVGYTAVAHDTAE